MRRFLWLSLGALLLASIAVASSGGATQAEARWVITDLGTLGGMEGEALDVNNLAHVVGWAETKSANPYSDISRAFIWQSGKMRDLGTFGGAESGAVAINERGQVVGTAKTKKRDEYGPIWRAFLWENGKMRDLGTFGGTSSRASDINERGQIVGASDTDMTWEEGSVGGFINHAFLWEKGKMRYLGTLGGDGSEAFAINGRGQVVGTADTKARRYGTYGDQISRGFLWQSGKMRDLGTLGGRDSEATSINDQGQIVGWAATKAKDEDGDPIWHAFLWQSGKMRDLGTLGGHHDSEATAINDQGQIVGWAATKARNEDGYPISHAFLWENGKMHDLGALDGWWSEAYGINSRGQVVGWSETKNDKRHAVLWTLKR